jgi:phosphoribosylformylglycinamidine synthase
MEWKIEVGYKPGLVDPIAAGMLKEIEDIEVSGVDSVRINQLYIVDGDLSECDVRFICENLLTDITQTYACKGSLLGYKDADVWIVEVTYKPGVTDPVGDSVLKGIRDLGIDGAIRARTGRKYIIGGSLNEDDIEIICKRLLANDVIQNYSYMKVN